MKRILSYLKNYKKETVLAPLFKLLEALFELTVPLVIRSLVNDGILAGDSPLIWKRGALLLVLAAVGFAAAVTAQYFAAKAAIGVGTDLRSDLFRRIQEMEYQDLDRAGTSTLLARLSGDTNLVQSGVNMALRLYLRSPFIVFGAMIMAFTVDVSSGFIFAVLIPLLFLVVFTVLLLTVPLYTKVQKKLDAVLRKTRENLRGTRVVRAFRLEEKEKEDFDRENDGLEKMQKFAGKISVLLSPATLVLVNAATIILVYTGGIRVESGTLTAGALIALYNYMAQILTELVKLANLVITSTRAVASGKRIAAVLETENLPIPETAADKSGTENTAVAFRSVSFRYPAGQEDTLHDISFTAYPGETVGIIGGTGSGKSTLVSLIPGLYPPTAGKVFLFGEDVTALSREKVLASVALVPQKAVLFSGTLRDNLLFGNPGATENDMLNALRFAEAYDFVMKKGGLDTAVEEDGRNFSGGQKQRLTIARALVKKPRVLILDDSSSALDLATDARLRASLRKLPKETTVFIVSQRISAIRNADRILVLDDGEAVSSGTHETLLTTSDVYREITESQSEKEATV